MPTRTYYVLQTATYTRTLTGFTRIYLVFHYSIPQELRETSTAWCPGDSDYGT